MKITALSIENVKGFRGSHELKFSNTINIFVGPNNSGKTTVLQLVLALQNGFSINNVMTRSLYSKSSFASIIFKNPIKHIADIIRGLGYSDGATGAIEYKSHENGSASMTVRFEGNFTPFSQIPSSEPDNLFYPYLSKRKVDAYSEDITLKSTNTISGKLTHLSAKVDRISNPQFQPAYAEYVQACEEILGFIVSSIASHGGKKPAYIVKNMDHTLSKIWGRG